MSIHTRRCEVGVITGGKDGVILFWDANLKQKNKIILSELVDVKISNYKITAICESNNGVGLAIGTRGGDIIEIINSKAK
jgi:hypothetical protein